MRSVHSSVVISGVFAAVITVAEAPSAQAQTWYSVHSPMENCEIESVEYEFQWSFGWRNQDTDVPDFLCSFTSINGVVHAGNLAFMTVRMQGNIENPVRASRARICSADRATLSWSCGTLVGTVGSGLEDLIVNPPSPPPGGWTQDKLLFVTGDLARSPIQGLSGGGVLKSILVYRN
jgi:hypothetical protein